MCGTNSHFVLYTVHDKIKKRFTKQYFKKKLLCCFPMDNKDKSGKQLIISKIKSAGYIIN